MYTYKNVPKRSRFVETWWVVSRWEKFGTGTCQFPGGVHLTKKVHKISRVFFEWRNVFFQENLKILELWGISKSKQRTNLYIKDPNIELKEFPGCRLPLTFEVPSFQNSNARKKKKKKNREPLHIFKTQKRKRKREGILKKQRKWVKWLKKRCFVVFLTLCFRRWNSTCTLILSHSSSLSNEWWKWAVKFFLRRRRKRRRNWIRQPLRYSVALKVLTL